ncbi:mycofactocin biosynthesis peptidyl-dipeptidase MftE [Cryptosporangium aurantiacum]|uniref:Creatinine amidohydrolase n=1 Tax=Cryptosporangium aurantiacum TaxID=134849 RepID=A0A1M7RPW0_9ACTN|nr:mycofactocin biosynthesis peptidyl-dipeptidase MftE [Cryptosporangium aurantiacum]SHN48136.1 creatinine amidohydrolase [Cryptosporangium aurantiacum]
MNSLADRTWPEISGDQVLAIPVGSTEQHGPHLPFSTDTDVAVALARALAARRDDVLVAPALPYGSSGEHQAFPGTLSIGPQAIELVLVELGRSASETFGRILLISGHGGNAIPVNRAVRRLRSEGRDALAWAPRWRGDAHAGRTETSVQLALDPHRVRLDRAEPGNTAPLSDLLPVMREQGLRPVTANGVLGDPSGADAEEGTRLLAEATDDLATTVARWLGEDT